jgi:hypothetical protein
LQYTWARTWNANGYSRRMVGKSSIMFRDRPIS